MLGQQRHEAAEADVGQQFSQDASQDADDDDK